VAGDVSAPGVGWVSGVAVWDCAKLANVSNALTHLPSMAHF